MSVGRSDSRTGVDGSPETMSPAARRVVEALIEGAPVSPHDREALTEAERAEVASFARTAHLTRLTLQNENPDPTAEQASLDRARTQLASRPPGTVSPQPPATTPTGGFPAWVKRLIGIQEDDE
jgi:hypothetical protein